MTNNKELGKEKINDLIILFKKKEYFQIEEKIKYLKKDFPNSIFLLDLLGISLVKLKKYKEAVKYFKKILNIEPNFADAHFNLAIIYKLINKINDSIIHYNLCIKINPQKFEAYNNLANIQKEQKNNELAIQNYLNCLEINPNYKIAIKNFGICLQNYKFTITSTLIEKHIINLLEQNKILRPVDIINTIIGYLYLNPKFKKITEKTNEGYLLEDTILEISNMKIFILLLENTPITDLKIEKVLKNLRSNILLNLSSIKNRQVALKFTQSLAKQCFINEYLYPINKDEEKILTNLEQRIIQNLKDNQFNNIDLEVACLASYNPLRVYGFSEKIKKIKSILDLINQQIYEPKKECDIKKEIISFKIKDKISLDVKDQYENNPYPRWNKISLYDSPNDIYNFFKNINIKINYNQIRNLEKINVLVAGCGTGQHAITTSSKYKNSFVTAIDLSKKSLSYAKRKADELGIQNIQFVQMDLLDLKKLERKFDIIESVGVLHHMDNPFKGWKRLYEFLKPNGLMMIGLYSKHARKHINQIREDISKKEIEVSEKNIIKYREEIISSSDLKFNIIKKSTDFYSLSSVRDLLFHTQEHTFTIQQIIRILNKLKLKFCGFENKEIVNLFKKKHKDINALYDLDLWHNFEINNPRIFAGMYQFWCQKF